MLLPNALNFTQEQNLAQIPYSWAARKIRGKRGKEKESFQG
jgi:hypothetical protein